VAPKSWAGRRTVPVPAALRQYLLEHRLVRGRRSGLFFGRDDGRPFSNQATTERARRRWRRAGLEPIGLHECRHTFASLMIAAGVNAKTLSAYMGHTSVTITLDRYGHLFPGSESEAAALLDAYLERAKKRGRPMTCCCTAAALRCTNRGLRGAEGGRLMWQDRRESARGTSCKQPTFRPAKRRGRDSNPRRTLRPLTVFETAPFNHSGTPPGALQVE